ncbi:MAG: DUF402 domain-containing protein [bacterium]|nr:DUF402 domain-containing protein [bacterium]
MSGAAVIVQKLDERGAFVWQYEGVIIAHDETSVCLEAQMGRDVPTDYVHFRKGDRMTEYFYTDRWYNIFRIEDVDDGRLKGWYCNITRPARFDLAAVPALIRAEDVALDVFVSPHGTVRVLDEDEFAALNLPTAEQAAAWDAVATIQALVKARTPPFDEIA